MNDVGKEEFEAAEKALLAAFRTIKDFDGKPLFLATRKLYSRELENAVVIALMALSGVYVKPENTKFIHLRDLAKKVA